MFNSCPPLERWSFLAKADKATWPDLPMDLRGVVVRSVVPHGSRLTALIKQQVLWVLSLHTSQFFPCKSWRCNLELLREVVLTAPDIYLPFATSCGNSTFPTPLPAAGLRPAGERTEWLDEGEPSRLIYHKLSLWCQEAQKNWGEYQHSVGLLNLTYPMPWF